MNAWTIDAAKILTHNAREVDLDIVRTARISMFLEKYAHGIEQLVDRIEG